MRVVVKESRGRMNPRVLVSSLVLGALVHACAPAEEDSAGSAVLESCGVISTGGEYGLAGDFEGSRPGSTEPCIVISASDVVLDCNDTEIDAGDSTSSTAVLVEASDVTVRRCVIRNHEVGILVSNSDQVHVASNTVIGGGTGIVLDGVADSEVTNNRLSGQQVVGIDLNGATANQVDNNEVSRVNGPGIQLRRSSENTLDGNTSSDNSVDGLVLGHSSDNTITNNLLARNDFRGLHLFDESSDNVARSNVSRCNTLVGFAIYTLSTKNTLVDNLALGNVHGFGLLHEAPGNTLEGNASWNNTSCGFYFESASDNQVTDNVAAGNGRCGLAVLPPPPDEGADPEGNEFVANTFLDSDYGTVIASHLVDTNVLSDSQFAGNGDPQITPTGAVLSDFDPYVSAEPATCSESPDL